MHFQLTSVKFDLNLPYSFPNKVLSLQFSMCDHCFLSAMQGLCLCLFVYLHFFEGINTFAKIIQLKPKRNKTYMQKKKAYYDNNFF